MLAKVHSCAIVGLEAELVEVEVDVRRGLSSFLTVGLPDAAVRESRDRVLAAIKNSGLSFPGNSRITVNLAPADLRKEGPAYDLPIAVGILAASQQVWAEKLTGSLFIGELSLDGAVRPTKGGIAAGESGAAARVSEGLCPSRKRGRGGPDAGRRGDCGRELVATGRPPDRVAAD